MTLPTTIDQAKQVALQVSPMPATAHAALVILAREVERLDALINNPQTAEFLAAVRSEVAHQVERWGTTHDRAKVPEDWYWLIAYLAGKALAAAKQEVRPRYRHVKRGTIYEVLSVGEDENNRGNDVVIYQAEDDGKIWARPYAQFFDGRFEQLPATPPEKALHHCISTAAALANWWAAIKLGASAVQPGSSDLQQFLEEQFGPEALPPAA